MPPIYHITHADNLDRIIAHGQLWCDSERQRRDCHCVNIAHQPIKERRARTPVPVPPGGFLADYAPFYFGTHSPMLLTANSGNVAGYKDGEKSIVYLVGSVERVASAGLSWCFSDGHAVLAITKFFTDIADLNKIDWAIVGAKYWADTADDPDRMRKKQAEFLVHSGFPWTLFDEIGVYNPAMANRVNSILANAGGGLHPAVSVRRNWYYY